MIKKLVVGTGLERPLRTFFAVKPQLRCVNFVFQRLFRINGDTPFSVHYTSTVMLPKRLKIGRNVQKSFAVSGNCYIQALNGIEIGDGTIFAPGVKIISTNHDKVTHASTKEPPLKIGKHCWLGANAVVLPGVVLGDNVIVGAGAVVTRSFPSDVIIGGIPARVIGPVETRRPQDAASASPRLSVNHGVEVGR
ncbi:MAG: acyltransferase [Candidatus Krumholzibacteriia bacterium]